MSKDRRMGRSQRKRAEADPAMEVRDTVEDVQAMMARKSRGKAKFYDQTTNRITVDERRTLRYKNVILC